MLNKASFSLGRTPTFATVSSLCSPPVHWYSRPPACVYKWQQVTSQRWNRLARSPNIAQLAILSVMALFPSGPPAFVVWLTVVLMITVPTSLAEGKFRVNTRLAQTARDFAGDQHDAKFFSTVVSFWVFASIAVRASARNYKKEGLS